MIENYYKYFRDKFKNIDKILFFLYYVFSSILFPLLNLGHITTKVIVPFYLLFLLLNSSKVFLNATFKFLIIFFIWTLFSSLFANDYGRVASTTSRLFITLIQSFVLFIYIDSSKERLLFALKITLLNSILYIIIIVYFGSIIFFSDDVFRLNPEENSLLENDLLKDTNTFGYFMYSGLTSLVLLYLFSKKNIYKILFILICLFSYQILQFTASRGSFVIFVLFVVGVYLSYTLFISRSKFKYLYLLVFLLILSISADSFFFNFSDSILGKRFLVIEEEESTRQLHIKEAIRVGLQNPFLGVGSGNYSIQPRNFENGSFSHNTYSEAFANYGFPGLILLLLIYFEFLYLIIIKIRKSIIYVFYLLILSTFLIYNFFYVTYLTIDFMGIYIIARISIGVPTNKV